MMHVDFTIDTFRKELDLHENYAKCIHECFAKDVKDI